MKWGYWVESIKLKETDTIRITSYSSCGKYRRVYDFAPHAGMDTFMSEKNKFVWKIIDQRDLELVELLDHVVKDSHFFANESEGRALRDSVRKFI